MKRTDRVFILLLFSTTALSVSTARAEYPAEIATRPLALPDGVYQLTSTLSATRYNDFEIGFGDTATLDLEASAGTAIGELAVVAGFALNQSDDFESDSLQRLGVSARATATERSIVELRGALIGPSSEFRRLQLAAAWLGRIPVSSAVAVTAGGGLGYGRDASPEGGDSVRAAVDAEIISNIAAQLGGPMGAVMNARVRIPLSDRENGVGATAVLGGRIVLTQPFGDVFVGASLLVGASDGQTLLVGIAGRLGRI